METLIAKLEAGLSEKYKTIVEYSNKKGFTYSKDELSYKLDRAGEDVFNHLIAEDLKEEEAYKIYKFLMADPRVFSDSGLVRDFIDAEVKFWLEDLSEGGRIEEYIGDATSWAEVDYIDRLEGSIDCISQYFKTKEAREIALKCMLEALVLKERNFLTWETFLNLIDSNNY